MDSLEITEKRGGKATRREDSCKESRRTSVHSKGEGKLGKGEKPDILVVRSRHKRERRSITRRKKPARSPSERCWKEKERSRTKIKFGKM